jgi:glycosyltransferase involved in cell wall biosynthesis
MNDHPDISVVMGVYNAAQSLRETVESILSQEGVSLEFIVVNDGSTDETPLILEEYARRDSRLKLIHQQNCGLTKALIRGCDDASGKYIARQDAGDISLPGRLAKQFRYISNSSHAAFISCGSRFLGPNREHLYEIIPNVSDGTESLLTLELSKIKGPAIHGCTMFPREIYKHVGGYRAQFYFAQDLDLWIRMAEHGRHVVMPDILYEASVSVGSISSVYRERQIETARFILESARLRRSGLSDAEVLKEAETIRPDEKRSIGRIGRAKALYFIGMCLRRSRSPHAASYFKQALLANPLHLKSIARLLLR